MCFLLLSTKKGVNGGSKDTVVPLLEKRTCPASRGFLQKSDYFSTEMWPKNVSFFGPGTSQKPGGAFIGGRLYWRIYGTSLPIATAIDLVLIWYEIDYNQVCLDI